MAEINDLSTTDNDNTGRFPESQLPNTVNDGARALEGMLARAFADTIDGAVTTGGTTTAYTYAANRGFSAYYDGLTLAVEWNATCGASPTINVTPNGGSALGAKALYWPNGDQVASGELVADGRALIQYDGTNFQVIGPRPPQTLGTAASLDVGTSANNIVQLDGSARLPAVDGSQLTDISTADQTARDGVAYNAWEIARIDGRAVFAMPGWAGDVFTDETGVATKTNATYDAAGDYYHNPGTTGGESGGSAYDPDTYWTAASAAFDGTTSQTGAGSAYSNVDSATTERPLGYDLGSGNGLPVSSVTVYTAADSSLRSGGYSGDVTLRLLGSNDGSNWTALGTSTVSNPGSGATIGIASSDDATSYRYMAVGFACDSTPPEGQFYVAEIEFELVTGAPPDITIISNSITADSAPSELRVLFDIEQMEAATENTDFVGAASRDGGTTFTTGTLVKVSEVSATRAVWAATIDVSGQPSGTAARLRLVTANNKHIRLHRWALQSDQVLAV
jgi:hypothetical protein